MERPENTELGRAAWIDCLLETMPEMVIIMHRDGRVLEIHGARQENLTDLPENLIGQSIRRCFPKEEFQRHLRLYADCIKSGQTCSIEYDLSIKGKTLSFESSIRAIDNERLLTVVKEVTAQKRLLESYREETAYRKFLFDNDQSGVVILDENHRVVEVNPQFCNMTGYSPEELMTMHTWDWEAIMSASEIKKNFSIKTDVNQSFETRHRRKNGSLYDVEVSAQSFIWKGKRRVVCSCRDVSERKNAEEKIRESEARYRSIIAVSNTGGWEFHRSRNFLWCSPAYFEMLGLDPDHFPMRGESNLEQIWISLLHPDDRKRASRQFARYLEEGSKGMYEQYFRMRHKSGEWVWIWSRGQTLLLEDGRVSDVTVGTHINISELKKTELENQVFRTIAEKAVFGMAIADLNGHLGYVNPFFAKLHGYTPEELTGKHLSVLHNEKHLPSVRQLVGLLMQQGHFGASEVWHVDRQGKEFPMLMSAVLIRDELGQPQYLVSSAVDLSSYHQTEQKYASLFNAMLNGFAVHEIILDDHGQPVDYRFLAVNPAFERLTGLSTAQLVGRTVREVLPGTEEYWIEKYGKVALTGEPVFFEQYSSALNKHFEVTSFRPAPGQFACVFQDVSERIKTSEALLRAKEKAEESDRLKTAFLQNMSHEIRTPLNAIIGFSDLINHSSPSPEKLKHFAGIILERGYQLSAIIDDIITISSIETRQEELKKSPFNVNELINETIEVFGEQAARKGIRLERGDILPETSAWLNTDKYKLMQVLNNLITNALKFTSRGRVVLMCRAEPDSFLFSVSDTGIGIEKDKTKLIFERFTQANETIRHDYGGTGLGLSICKGFIELMGGRIWVESTIGEGATFCFRIPA